MLILLDKSLASFCLAIKRLRGFWSCLNYSCFTWWSWRFSSWSAFPRALCTVRMPRGVSSTFGQCAIVMGYRILFGGRGGIYVFNERRLVCFFCYSYNNNDFDFVEDSLSWHFQIPWSWTIIKRTKIISQVVKIMLVCFCYSSTPFLSRGSYHHLWSCIRNKFFPFTCHKWCRVAGSVTWFVIEIIFQCSINKSVLFSFKN